MAIDVIGLYRQAYSGLPRRAWILFAVNLVNSSGAMVLFFLSLYLTRKLGFTTARAGLALSLYGAGSLAGALAGGWLADRVGSIRIQKTSLAMSGALLIALGQARTAAAILPLLFVIALFWGMLYPANATSMSRICPAELRIKGFALNRLAGNLGATIGPAVGGVLALRDYRLLFWADGLTSLAAAAVFAALWREPRAKGETKGEGEGEKAAEAIGERPGEAPDTERSGAAAAAAAEPRSPWRDPPFLALLLIFLVWSAVFIQLFATFPLYMRNAYGLAENRIGQLFVVNTLIIVFLEMILMEKVRKYPLARMINLSFLLVGAGLGLLPLGRSFAFAAFCMAILTFGEMLSMPLATALIAGRAGAENCGRYMGMFSFSFSLAFIIAPAAGTAIYDRFGDDMVWVVCAALCALITAVFSALRPRLER
jgi:MFS family permease